MTTTILFPLLSGIVQAGVFALVVRAAARRHSLGMYALLLLVAAVLYVVFAARAGEPGGVMVELAGTAVFGAIALLGVRRRSPGMVALGWALHPVWDAVLHTTGTMAAYTPDGYVVACIGFDLLLAALLVRGWAGESVRLAPAAQG